MRESDGTWRSSELDVISADASKIVKAIGELKKIAPNTGSYVAESSFFEDEWQKSYWGSNYPKLLSIKQSTTRTVCSSFITASAAKHGAPTVLPGLRSANARSSLTRLKVESSQPGCAHDRRHRGDDRRRISDFCRKARPSPDADRNRREPADAFFV